MRCRRYISVALLFLATCVATNSFAQAQSVPIKIHFRWDKSELDKSYLTNGENLQRLDSLLSVGAAEQIDTIRIVAYASPEGTPEYNQRLSERRAATICRYLETTYPELSRVAVVADARGENWEGFYEMAKADAKLPMREKVLEILKAPISDIQRQAQIERLDGGRLYRNYILPNYYRYLRNAASLLIIYTPEVVAEVEVVEEVKPPRKTVEIPIVDIVYPKPQPEAEVKCSYPIALRTNLLYDAMGAVNAGIEIPIKEHFSLILDGAYSYWRSNNLYALQTLEYGTELRYWFGVSDKRKSRNENWSKPLKGWNVGVYGRYWQRYDVQAIEGYQGDGSWSAGLTAGYAFPISKQLSLEASIGGGWFSTSQYRHYHKPQEGHLMWQETGSWSGFTLTKVRFSLVWLIQKRGGQK